MTVVGSAGNHGRDANGNELFGRITMPGVSPFAITVGALNTKGTAQRSDDVITTYSSRGPTWFDGLIKPDLVAPGNKIVGLLAPKSTLAREHPELVIDTTQGKRLQLSGSSMSAAAVSGAAALVLEAMKELHPEAVRHLLQQTASEVANTTPLQAGTGSLNVRGSLAVDCRTGIGCVDRRRARTRWPPQLLHAINVCHVV